MKSFFDIIINLHRTSARKSIVIKAFVFLLSLSLSLSLSLCVCVCIYIKCVRECVSVQMNVSFII